MTAVLDFEFCETDLDALAEATGKVALLVDSDGKLDPAGRRVNRLTKGALARFVECDDFAEMKTGAAKTFAFPAGMEAEAVIVAKLPRRATVAEGRKAGVSIAKALSGRPAILALGNTRAASDVVLGLALRAYEFRDHKTDEKPAMGAVQVMATKADELKDASEAFLAVAEGVFFTRDLVTEPANILTTTEFADRLAALSDLGVKVEVLEEDELEDLGMRTLLGVGEGSESPSKVVVMQWNEGGDEAPLALVGKGVVFDTGGISLKPAGGMEDMTMDMGGAGVVAGVMKTIALRGARANVVGLVGLVENMPDGKAQRPGDVVTSMKGDTVEIINTDAEGRLVLADVLWYAQERFAPSAMVDLATLTGAIIIGLGHDNAGVFSNDDDFCGAFLSAAQAEGEGAWRMPLDASYDKQLKSAVADMKNVGTRAAGSVTAAKFLQRFVKEDVPWIHLDIAGVASVASETTYAPKGASGWGVMALNRLIRDRYED